jgi:Ser/Thr protein kinase RdoA (MazF antagonist)
LSPWDESGWLEQAGEWIAAELGRAGIEPTRPPEMLKNRPWSCVLELPTSRGRVFMKAASPVTGHEPAPARWDEIQARVAPLRARLDAPSVPDSVQHDDLHGGNILISDAGPIVFDWGDSCISHPFMTLTVTFRVIAWSHELAGAEGWTDIVLEVG